MAVTHDTGMLAGDDGDPDACPGGRRPVHWLAAATLVSIALTGLAASRERDPGFSPPHVAFWWVASIILAATLATVLGTRRGVPVLATPSLTTAGSWLLMTAVAALPRVWLLPIYPSFLDADEAAFLIHGREFLEGEMANPFGLGFTSHPLLYMVTTARVAELFGGSVTAHRAVSVLLGTIGVLAAWRLGIRLFGTLAGTLGAVLLATWPLHLHVSLSGMNNITDPTFLALALLFVVLAMDQRRSLYALLAGFAVGCALYGYYGGRAMPVVLVAVVVLLGLVRRTGLNPILSVLAWMTLGLLAVATPLLVAFRYKPAEFGGHLSMVSSLSPATMLDDPLTVIPTYLDNLWDAFTYPVAGNGEGFFRHPPPYSGWPLTVLLITGLAVAVARAVRRKEPVPLLVVVVPYLLLVGGIAFTMPILGQRYAAMTPLLALLAGLGLAFLVEMARKALPAASRLPLMLAIIVVASIGAANMTWMAADERQIETYGDIRTLMMWDIGWRLGQAESATGDAGVLLLAGPPYVFARGFPNLTFLAPGVDQVNVETTFGPGSAVPELTPGSIVLLVPERFGERCALETTYPGASIATGRARNGTTLYIAVYRQLTKGWPSGTSPAGTTFTPFEETPCGP